MVTEVGGASDPATEHMPAIVSISARGEERLRSGHPWIYRSDVVEVDAAAGDTVVVRGARGRRLGSALFSDRSQITLRMLAYGDASAGIELWRARIDQAVRFRERLGIDATAYRLIHGEADLLPSLVVDRYGEYLVVQALSQGTDRLMPEIVKLLVERLQPAGVLARNDPKVRALEGLDQHVRALHGEIPPAVVVREGPIEYEADLWKGQKTGLFLDQRENHEAAARYGSGRALDCFSYGGGFAMRLAPACADVQALDISADAVARIQQNAARNQLSVVTAREVNVFDELRRLERAGERFDTIVLDPPAFAKSKAAVESAVAGYKDINLRALRLLSPGGTLVTCSCSYHVDEALFIGIVEQAALDAHARVTIVEKRMQGRDHPVLLSAPETYYLKCLILRRLE